MMFSLVLFDKDKIPITHNLVAMVVTSMFL